MTVHHAELAKTARQELLIVTHVRLATTAHRARSTVMHVRLVMTAHRALSIVTHAHRATRVTAAVVSKIAQQELSTEQNLAALASSTTDHASLIATTATTAPTVVQTALTVSTATAIVTAPSKEHARATQTRRPSLKIRSLSVSRA
jgi:hypothetical protein